MTSAERALPPLLLLLVVVVVMVVVVVVVMLLTGQIKIDSPGRLDANNTAVCADARHSVQSQQPATGMRR